MKKVRESRESTQETYKPDGAKIGGLAHHSIYCDLIITGLIGLRPRADDLVEVNPLVPDGKWDWFCLDNVRYHGRVLTIVWDKTGEKYAKGKGLRIFVDGKQITHRDTFGRLTGRLTATN